MGEKLRALLKSRYLVVAVVVLVCLLLVAVAYSVGLFGAMAGSRAFWPVVLVIVGALGFAALQWGVPWLRERRFVQSEESEFPVAGQESPEEFRARFVQALTNLQRLPQLKSASDPIYALPWYLMLGGPGVGKTAALRGAGFSSLLGPADDGATKNFEWWVSTSAMVIDTAGRYALPIDPNRDRLEWYRLLRLLHHHRERDPINGVIICVGADELINSSDEETRVRMTKLRERLEEAVRELGTDFPLYLLVTKCDRLAGFQSFVRALPASMSNDAFGYVDDQATADGGKASRGAAALQRLRDACGAIYERLHFLRTAVWQGNAGEQQRQAVFRFPEELRALEPSLLRCVEALCTDDVRYHTPLFRGIFFATSGGSGEVLSPLGARFRVSPERTGGGSTGAFFLRDIFETMLPRDASLSSITPRERRRRGVMGAARGGAALLIAGLLLVTVAGVFISDRRTAAAVSEAECPESFRGDDWKKSLAMADRCRAAVQAISAADSARSDWSRWLSDQTGARARNLRQRYLDGFRADVLGGLNRVLDDAFQHSSDPLPFMLAVARRISIMRRCSNAACNSRVVGELEPDYALLANPGEQAAAESAELAQLKTAYPAYLLWRSAESDRLEPELADDRQRLRQWLSAKQFRIDRILPLVNRRSAPITYDDYWQKPASVAAAPPPQVDGACTAKIWENEVAPFLQQVQDALPEATAQLQAFQESYDKTCLSQWRQFLLEFPTGADRWRGPDLMREITLQLLTDSSPCSRVIDDAHANLRPWTHGDRAWAEALARYSTSDQRRNLAAALKTVEQRLQRGSAQAAAFAIAQEAFTENKVAAESTSPLLRAWWLASQPPAEDKKTADGGDVIAALTQEPLRYVWRVILDEAAAHVQKAWIETVSTPLRQLSAAEQVVQLYGPGGRMTAFTEQYLRPFLNEEEGDKPRALLDRSLPFSPQFAQVLTNAKELKPVFAGEVSEPVVVRATQSAQIDAQTRLLADRTLLSIVCSGKTYRVSDTSNDAAAETSATIPWTATGCSDVNISVYFYADSSGSGKRLQLTKVYPGAGALLQFAHDFADGPHRFQLDDFSNVDPDVLASRVVAVQVHYKLELPPSLTKVAAALQEPMPDEIAIASTSFASAKQAYTE